MQANTQAQGWHIAQWETWGWAETILKLVALGAGVAAFVRSLSDGALEIGGGVGAASILLLLLVLLLSLGSVFQLYVRWQQRETISMIFAIVNLLGHFGLLFALLHVPHPRTLPIVFGVFYALGQVVKIQFLRVTGYTEGGATTRAMLRIAAIMAVLYALVVVLVLL